MENKIKIEKCFCGKKPTLSHQIHCDGESEYWNEQYVECPCGLRGKSFDTNHTAIGLVEASAINWWNEFILKHKTKITEGGVK